MRIDVLTLFPEVFEPFLGSSIVGRACKAGLVTIRCVDFRDFTRDKHRSVDDRPFGGGPGMVLMCQPVFDALEYVEAKEQGEPARILLTPQGSDSIRALWRSSLGSLGLLSSAGTTKASTSGSGPGSRPEKSRSGITFSRVGSRRP